MSYFLTLRRMRAKYNKDPIKRSIKTLAKRSAASGYEWSCAHCPLMFDNPTVLNLHTLTHAAENIDLAETAGMAPSTSEELKLDEGQILNIDLQMLYFIYNIYLFLTFYIFAFNHAQLSFRKIYSTVPLLLLFVWIYYCCEDNNNNFYWNLCRIFFVQDL